MLVGVSAARADELSLTDWLLLAPGLPATTGIFPRLPENWSDLPLQLHLTEQVGYNSNITNTPSSTGALSAGYGRPIGSLESISTYGASFKNEVGGQQFFADVTWGMYRYLDHVRFNSAHSSADIGDNFTYGSECKGSLRASEASAPSQPGQQVGFNVINTVTTVALNENAQCVVTGEWSGVFNSGTTVNKNSALTDKPNDYQSVFVAAGMNYSVSETDSLQALATITGIDYTNRQTSGQTGLLSKLTTDQVTATYTKNFGPDIAVSAQIGLIGVEDGNFSLGIPRTILPEYSLSLQWAATPKFSFNASLSRQASPPTSVVSNLQITESASAGITYHWTPKISLAGNLSTSDASSSVGSVATAASRNIKSYGAGLKLGYTISPFFASELSYEYTKTVQSFLTTNTSVILLALNFNPY